MLLSSSFEKKCIRTLLRSSFSIFCIDWYVGKRVVSIPSNKLIGELALTWHCKTLYLSKDLYFCRNDFFSLGNLGNCWNYKRNTSVKKGNCARVLNNDGDENDDKSIAFIAFN